VADTARQELFANALENDPERLTLWLNTYTAKVAAIREVTANQQHHSFCSSARWTPHNVRSQQQRQQRNHEKKHIMFAPTAQEATVQGNS